MNRDLRIDFLRGSILLLIAADHVLNNVKAWFSLNSWVYFDAAAGFVFMSGLVCGMAYGKVLLRDGWRVTQRKALRRVFQLYVAQIALFAVVCTLFLLFLRYKEMDPGPYGLAPLFNLPGIALVDAGLLLYSPWLMDILKLYIVLLVVLPGALWLYRRSRVAALGLSFAVYAVVQKFPEICPHDYPADSRWFWNPLGWQMLFLGAAALGFERARGNLTLPRNPRLIVAAVAALAAIVYLRLTDALPWMWTDRQKLAPMQVASFAIGAYLIAVCLRPQWKFWSSAIAKPIIRCGRHSLPVFCSSVVIDYVISMLFETIRGATAQVLIVAGGVLLTLLVGNVIDWLTRPTAAPLGTLAAATPTSRPMPGLLSARAIAGSPPLEPVADHREPALRV